MLGIGRVTELFAQYNSEGLKTLTWGESLDLKPQGRRPVVCPSGHHLTILGGEALILIISRPYSKAVCGFRIAVGVYVRYLSKVLKMNYGLNFHKC